MARKKHISARGKEINFDELFLKNQKTIAVTGGGAAMNAKGDMLGQGGMIIEVSEVRDRISNPQPAQEGTAYNENNPNAVRQVSVKDNIDDLAALIPTSQVTVRDDAEEAKTPEQVIKELGQRLENVSETSIKDDVKVNVQADKPSNKNKRKIVDTEE